MESQLNSYPVLDHYKLIENLGSGGFSKVKLGIDLNTGLKYAIKIFRTPKEKLDKKTMENFATEILAMKTLSHPNLIRLIDCNDHGLLIKPNGKVKQVIYLVLELAMNGELFDFVALSGRFSEKTARYFFKQLIAGLEYIHSRGYAHRDLKPENIFLDEHFNLKIADFGFTSQLGGR